MEVLNFVGSWIGVRRLLGLEAWRATFRPDLPTIDRVASWECSASDFTAANGSVPSISILISIPALRSRAGTDRITVSSLTDGGTLRLKSEPSPIWRRWMST